MKKTGLKISIFLILICISIGSFGQTTSATIKKIWAEYDIYKSGDKGMNIHVNFSVSGMLKQQGDCVVWFYNSDETQLKDKNGSYSTTKGNVCTSEYYKPSYESSNYSDFDIFMPYDELHLGSGSYSLKFKVGIFDNNNKQIATSEYYDFTYKNTATTNNNYSNNSNSNSSYNNNNNTTITDNANGSKTMTMKMNCFMCSGIGKITCACCMGMGQQRVYVGLGYNYSPIYNYVLCQCCGGAGKQTCTSCYGSGYTVTSSTYYPDATVTPSSGGYNSGGSGGYYNSGGNSGNSSSSSTKRTCPGCNGTGKGVDQITYSPNYTGSNNDKYCSQCGRTGPAHTHHTPTCKVCYGKGYVD